MQTNSHSVLGTEGLARDIGAGGAEATYIRNVRGGSAMWSEDYKPLAPGEGTVLERGTGESHGELGNAPSDEAWRAE